MSHNLGEGVPVCSERNMADSNSHVIGCFSEAMLPSYRVCETRFSLGTQFLSMCGIRNVVLCRVVRGSYKYYNLN